MSSSSIGTTAGATTASPERVFSSGSPFLFAPDFRSERREGSPADRGWRILRAITQEREERELCGGEPQPSRDLPAARPAVALEPGTLGRMESFELSVRTKSLWLVAAVAAAVFWIALLLVARLVT